MFWPGVILGAVVFGALVLWFFPNNQGGLGSLSRWFRGLFKR